MINPDNKSKSLFWTGFLSVFDIWGSTQVELSRSFITQRKDVPTDFGDAASDAKKLMQDIEKINGDARKACQRLRTMV